MENNCMEEEKKALKVRNAFPEYYEMLDEECDKKYVLKYKGVRLYKGQLVPCRIIYNTNKNPFIEVIENELSNLRSQITQEKITSILKDGTYKWEITPFINILLSNQSESLIQEETYTWLKGLVEGNYELGKIRSAITFLLDQSKFLTLCNDEERKRYQIRLTSIIEQLGYYIKALTFVKDGQDDDAEKFVDSLFKKLQESGYVYHPQKNIQMMTCLFNLNPDIMQAKIQSFFDVIRSHELKIWLEEPFRSSFIKSLEVYINENDKHADTLITNGNIVKLMIQAIAIQLLLINENETLFDYNLTKAKIFRYISYLNEKNIRDNLNLAYASLNGITDKLIYKIDQTKNVSVLAEIVRTAEIKELSTPSVLRYETDRFILSMTPHGLIIQKSDTTPHLKNILPSGMLDWKDIQILLNKDDIHSVPTEKNRDVLEYKNFWLDVERALFDPIKRTVQPVSKKKFKPSLGDTVSIYITEVDSVDKYLLHADIEDETFQGSGTIHINDIVRYKIAPQLKNFRSASNQPLIFQAKVQNIKNDGECEFSMIEGIDKMTASYGYHEQVKCSIGQYNEGYNRYIGVSENGYSVSIDAEDTELNKHDVVYVTCTNIIKNNYIMAEMESEAIDDSSFLVSDAFQRLLTQFSIGEIDDEQTDESENVELDQTDIIQVNETYVTELMKIIDRVSTSEEDYIKSYNYIALAKLLAKIINNTEKVRYYEGKMQLLLTLNRFEVNENLDLQELMVLEKENEKLYQNCPFLYYRFKLLKIVGHLNLKEQCQQSDEDLWNMGNDVKDPTLKEMVRLVMAHNLLIRSNLSRQATDVLQRIKTMLKVESKQSHLKSYGLTEDTYHEFKTSIVFPPNNNMKPDLEAQTKNIMKSLATLLNSKGGILYLGVNDAGMGVGLENDLKYKKFNEDKDAYIRHINDSVKRFFGQAVCDYVTIYFDKENYETDVCILEIKPYLKGVMFDGDYPVRQNNTTAHMNLHEFKAHNKIRQKSLNLF